MTIGKLFKLTKNAGRQSIKMQNRLVLYWGVMILVVFAAILAIMSFAGVFSDSEERVAQVLSLQQKNTFSQISEDFNRLTAQGISLSEKASEIIEEAVIGGNISELNDSPEKLKEIESRLYDEMNIVLRTSPCSGAYIVFNATTNTSAPGAGNSRAGLYLRFANLSSDNEANRDIALYRGIADVARAHDIELHNRWKLEFDIEKISGFENAASFSGRRIADGCFWTGRENITDTWESCIMLTVPIVSGSGEFYGVCGVEVSDLYFRLINPAMQSDFGGMVTVLAPIKGDELMVSEGMIGGINGTLIRGTENFVIKEGSLFNTYIGRDTRFCGIQQETEIILEDGTVLYAVTLVPEDHYIKEDAANRIIWGIATAILFVAMLFISFLLAKNFVKPIAQSLEAIQEDDFAGAGSSGISEIDSLLSFIRKKGSGKSETNLPSDIEELFSDFAKRAEALTPTERSIIKYYADGKEVSEIPELCFISINTVRKHNSNIYKKLGVGSKEELMLYIELFRRSGRSDELF